MLLTNLSYRTAKFTKAVVVQMRILKEDNLGIFSANTNPMGYCLYNADPPITIQYSRRCTQGITQEAVYIGGAKQYRNYINCLHFDDNEARDTWIRQFKRTMQAYDKAVTAFVNKEKFGS